MAVKHALHEAYTPCPCVYVTKGFWHYRLHASPYAWWEIRKTDDIAARMTNARMHFRPVSRLRQAVRRRCVSLFLLEDCR